MTNGIFNLVGMLVARMRSQDGQTMAEYGILIAVIAVIVVVAAVALGGSISSVFSSAGGKL
jgi:pilus assembly protein Flp/PilA